MDLDLDLLKGLKVKTMWSRKEEFDNLEMIRPLAEKVKAPSQEPAGGPIEENEEVPF